MTVLAVLNQSTVISDADAHTMAWAVNLQLRHVARGWRRPAWSAHFFPTAPPGAYPLVILDDSDQAGALGYHDETPDGAVYGRVFARPVLDNGGDTLHKPLSVASVLSHEALETFGDQTCNLWAQDRQGETTAFELCDPVENDSYPVGAAKVTVSNFVLPAWFDPHGHGPFDQLGRLSAPFTMSKGGYLIVMQAGKVTQRFGDDYPAWRRAGKTHPASRTARRTHKEQP